MTRPNWNSFRGCFFALKLLFDQVGIWKNVGKTLGMLCKVCRTVRTHSEAVYKQRMTGTGLTYRPRQKAPPTTAPLLWHDGTIGCSKHPPTQHLILWKVRGDKLAQVGGGGGQGGHKYGVQGICPPYHQSSALLVPGPNLNGQRLCLAVGSGQSLEV